MPWKRPVNIPLQMKAFLLLVGLEPGVEYLWSSENICRVKARASTGLVEDACRLHETPMCQRRGTDLSKTQTTSWKTKSSWKLADPSMAFPMLRDFVQVGSLWGQSECPCILTLLTFNEEQLEQINEELLMFMNSLSHLSLSLPFRLLLVLSVSSKRAAVCPKPSDLLGEIYKKALFRTVNDPSWNVRADSGWCWLHACNFAHT